MTRGAVRRRIWAMPAVLALTTLSGLLAALLGEGLWQPLAWAALAVPPGVAGWYGFLRR